MMPQSNTHLRIIEDAANIQKKSNVKAQQDHKRRRTHSQNLLNTKNLARSIAKRANSCASSKLRSCMEKSSSRIRQNYLRTIGIERQQENGCLNRTKNNPSAFTKDPIPTVQGPLECKKKH
eukprot:8828854-Ditylum_brightwellii.AAC.1